MPIRNEQMLAIERRRAHLPQRFWGLDLSDYRGSAPPQIVDYVRRFMADGVSVKDEYKGVGLLLSGPPGTGKTMLASIVLDLGIAYGVKGAWITLDSFVRKHQRAITLEQAWSKHDNDDAYDEWREWDDFYRRVMTARFLVLDDVGKEYTTDSGYTASLFDYLVRNRYDHMRPTFMTTNIPVSEWDETYSDAMHSFIAEAFVAVTVKGADQREAISGGR